MLVDYDEFQAIAVSFAGDEGTTKEEVINDHLNLKCVAPLEGCYMYEG